MKTLRTRFRIHTALATAAAAALFASAPALAVITTWDGGGANSNWATAANWNTNVVPPAINDVQFGSAFTSGTSIVMGGSRTVNSLIINTVTPFTIAGAAGNVLTLTSGTLTREDIFTLPDVEGDHIITAGVALGANANWSVWGSGTLAITGPISQTTAGTSLTKIGWGLLEIAGTGTYTGGTILEEAHLQLSGANARAGTGQIFVQMGAGLDVSGATVPNNLSLGGEGVSYPTGFSGALRALTSSTINGPVLLRANTTINAQPGTLTMNGVIDDAAPNFTLTKTGTGELRLNAPNTYGGGTAVNTGTLIVGNGAALGSGGVTVAAGASIELGGVNVANTLTINGSGLAGQGALRTNGSTNTWSGQINSTSGFAVGTTGPLTIAGPISALGLTITKTGAGTLTLTNPANSFGSLTIQSGSLTVASEDGLPPASSVALASGASVLLTGSATINRTLVLNGDGGTLGALGNVTGSPTWAGTIFLDTNSTIHTGGNITISGEISGPPRTITKKGTGRLVLANSNSFAALNITEGTVALQSNFGAPSGTTTVNSGAAFELIGNVTGTGASLRLSGHGVGGDGALRGASGTNTWGGAVNLDSSTTVFVAPGAQTTIAGVVSEASPAFSITKTGAGTLVLGALNTYSGGTLINEGTLSVSANNRLGTGPVSINGGKLLFTASTTTPRDFAMNSGRLQAAAGTNVVLDRSQLSGGFLMGPGTFEASSVTLNGVTALPGARLTPTGTTTLNAFINGGAIAQNNTLNWDGGFNTSSGTIDVNGTLNTTAFSNDGVITIHNAASLLNTGNALVSGGGSRIDIRSGGRLNVTGTLLDLNASLLVNNGTITGPTNVNFGSLAKGAGVYGAVNVTDGGKFSPGNSPGAVTTGSTTWNSGGSYLIEIADATGSPGQGFDTWLINGQLTLNASPTSNGKFTISLSSLDTLAANFDPTQNYSWPILHASDGILNFDPAQFSLDTSAFKNPLASGRFSLSSTSTDITLNFSAVPEPGALTLLVTTVAILSSRTRRKAAR
jgi:autotransporter-associated beta strand protein